MTSHPPLEVKTLDDGCFFVQIGDKTGVVSSFHLIEPKANQLIAAWNRDSSRKLVFCNWDLRFLSLAKHISDWSKDPSTKVGAVAVRNQRILATGYNGFPRGVVDSAERLHDRQEKLLRTVHAEANIVAQASLHGVSLNDSTVYIWPFLPCSSCCTLLIQAGVSRIVVPDIEIPERWVVSFTTSVEMLDEAGLKLERIASEL